MYILLRTYFTMTLLEIRLLDSKLSMSVAFYFLSSVVSENYFVPACESEILRQCIMCVERAPWKVVLLSISVFYDENGNSLRAVLLENLNFEADV